MKLIGANERSSHQEYTFWKKLDGRNSVWVRNLERERLRFKEKGENLEVQKVGIEEEDENLHAEKSFKISKILP